MLYTFVNWSPVQFLRKIYKKGARAKYGPLGWHAESELCVRSHLVRLDPSQGCVLVLKALGACIRHSTIPMWLAWCKKRFWILKCRPCLFHCDEIRAAKFFRPRNSLIWNFEMTIDKGKPLGNSFFVTWVVGWLPDSLKTSPTFARTPLRK